MKRAMVLAGVTVISVNILGMRVSCFEQKNVPNGSNVRALEECKQIEEDLKKVLKIAQNVESSEEHLKIDKSKQNDVLKAKLNEKECKQIEKDLKKILKIGQSGRKEDISSLERKKKGLVLWNAWAKDELRKNTKNAELMGYHIKENSKKIAELDQQIQQIKNSQNN